MTQDWMATVKDSVAQYTEALTCGMGIQQAKQRLMNIMFNNRHEIIDLFILTDKSAELKSEVEALGRALEEADRQVAELTRKKKTKGEGMNGTCEAGNPE